MTFLLQNAGSLKYKRLDSELMLPLQNVRKIDYSTYLRGTLLFGGMRFCGDEKAC